jgi:hypothetical protein
MNKRIRIAVLSACAAVSFAAFAEPAGTNERPVVTVRNGRVVSVQPNPLRFTVRNTPAKIVWTIDDEGQGHRFGGSEGITIDGRVSDSVAESAPIAEQLRSLENPMGEIGSCLVRPGRRELECTNKLRRAGRYKYTVKVQDRNGRDLPPHDPWIMNRPH